MASYIEINNLGSYANIGALWAAYPEGGQEGDYCTINSVKYHWDKYDRMWIVDPNYGPTPARSNENFDGDVTIQNNLTVAGYIRAKGIKQPCVGLFASLTALETKWPNPEVGMWAAVGDTFPADVYRCNTEADGWKATGETVSIDGLEFNIANGIAGWVPISSTSQLPTDPTPDQQGRGYLLGTMLYVYVGTGGDTLSGKYKSAQLKGATGETGPQGPSGVHEDDVTIADNLTTDDPLQVLSAKQGKVLEEHIKRNVLSKIKGINGRVDFSITLSALPTSCCVIFESMLYGEEIPTTSSQILYVFGRTVMLSSAIIQGNINTAASSSFVDSKEKMGVTVLNKPTSFNIDNFMVWSPLTKRWVSQSSQFVNFNNETLRVYGHGNVIIGDVIVIGRALEANEVIEAYSNPRKFIKEAIVFIPKEHYTTTSAYEAVSNRTLSFTNEGTIIYE